ncbi:hypothetical protein MMPV_002509 [Pyropia vietnamensis]
MNTHRSGKLLWAGVLLSGVAAHYGGKAYSRMRNAELSAEVAAYQERLAGSDPSPSGAPADAAATADVGAERDVFAAERKREQAAGSALSTAGAVVSAAAAAAIGFNMFSKNAAPNKVMHARIVMQGLAIGGLAALAIKETMWDTRQERS